MLIPSQSQIERLSQGSNTGWERWRVKAWLPRVCVCVCVCEPVKLSNNQSSFERKRKAVDVVKESRCDGWKGCCSGGRNRDTQTDRHDHLKYLGFIVLSQNYDFFRWNVNILDAIWNIQGGMTLDWRCKHVRCKIKLSEDSKSALCLSVVSIRLSCRILCNAFPVHFIVNTFTEILRYSINNSHVRSRQVNLLYVGNCLL